MPRWGRPPGARLGRHNGGVQWEGDARVEELISDNEDVFGRELVRSGRYGRQQDYGARGPSRQLEFEDYSDDAESIGDGGDYDIYEHGDSTVAYAVQLAMRDKEDQLVDSALDRIRRAQMLGKKNVRLSKRELAALERKRQTSSSGAGATQRSRKGSASSSRPSSRRNGHTVPFEQPYSLQQSGAYPPFAPDGGWGRPSSSSSANRPRTPTMQSLRPQQSISPLRPPYPMFPGTPPNSRPQSMHQPPMYARPLPDDPQWAPPYYAPMQMSPYPEQPPYPSQLPEDLRVGPQSRYSYSAGMPPAQVPHQVPHRRSISGRKSSGSSQPPTSPPKTKKESSSEEESGSSSEEDGDAPIVQVPEREVPAPVPVPAPTQAPASAQASPGLQRRRAPAGNKKGRQRTSR